MTASAPRPRPALRRAALLALTLALLLGGWLLLAPAPADADGNPGAVAWRQGNSSITAQLGEAGTTWGSVQNRNVCDRTASAPYADNGAWNAVAFRLGRGLPCRTHTPTAFDYPMLAYELKITSTDSTAHGETGDLVPGADIEYVSGLTCSDGSWRNADGETYNRIYARRIGASPDKGTFGYCDQDGALHVGNLPRVNIRFSVPRSHSGPVWLHLTMWANDAKHTHARLKFNAPAHRACVGPVERIVQQIGEPYDSPDAGSQVRYISIQVTATYNCNGRAYTSRTTYGAPVDRIPPEIHHQS